MPSDVPAAAPAVDPVVRELEPDDVDAVLDLFDEVAAEGRWIGREAPVDRGELRERYHEQLSGSSPTTTLVVDAEGEVVGVLGLTVAPYGVADLGMMLARDWRGRGLGTMLVDRAIAEARRVGAHKIALQVWPHNEAAIALYTKHGFVQEGRLRRHYRRASGACWDALVMGLLLVDR